MRTVRCMCTCALPGYIHSGVSELPRSIIRFPVVTPLVARGRAIVPTKMTHELANTPEKLWNTFDVLRAGTHVRRGLVVFSFSPRIGRFADDRFKRIRSKVLLGGEWQYQSTTAAAIFFRYLFYNLSVTLSHCRR